MLNFCPGKVEFPAGKFSIGLVFLRPDLAFDTTYVLDYVGDFIKKGFGAVCLHLRKIGQLIVVIFAFPGKPVNE